MELLLPLNVTDAAVSLAGTLTQGVPCSVTATAGDVSVSGSVTAQAGLAASAPAGNGIVSGAVGPLPTLILATGHRLVVMTQPMALLGQTRSVLRSRFSAVTTKHFACLGFAAYPKHAKCV